MINAAIVGLGWWGKTLVESVEGSDELRFVAGTSRTVSPELSAFAVVNNWKGVVEPDGAGVTVILGEFG